MNNYVTKDSGKREEHTSGAVRDVRKGKGRYDLLTPLGLARVAGVYERGAEKYAERNWEKGMKMGRYLDSAIRHIFQHIEGKRDEDHLAQAAWNLLAAVHTDEMIKRGLFPKEYDDMPNFVSEGNKS